MSSVNPQLVGSHLEVIAKQQTTIHYQTLASLFGMPDLNGIWITHPLASIFEVLDQEDLRLGRPFRTSVVISKAKNLPGKGFFESLCKLKGIQTNTDAERDAAFTNELLHAHAFPW